MWTKCNLKLVLFDVIFWTYETVWLVLILTLKWLYSLKYILYVNPFFKSCPLYWQISWMSFLSFFVLSEIHPKKTKIKWLVFYLFLWCTLMLAFVWFLINGFVPHYMIRHIMVKRRLSHDIQTARAWVCNSVLLLQHTWFKWWRYNPVEGVLFSFLDKLSFVLHLSQSWC